MPDSCHLPPAAIRTALAGAVLLSTAFLAGCPPVAKPPATMRAVAAPATAPVFGTEPVSGGIYVSLGASTPLTGSALTRAMSPRDVIAKTVNADLSVATAPATQPSEPLANTEAPPLAVKYYLQGREKFLDGANTEAMEFLEKALQLDPNAFTVLRLMGRVCFASSQLARGSLYLQRAQQSHPTDVEVNYLLGRYWLERKDSTRAIFYLMQADGSPERSMASAQTPMVSFYLARAFQAAGYHKAAASQYAAFLTITALPVPGYRYDRELNYLIEEPWATHLSIAENDAIVGDFAAALPEYRIAAMENGGEVFIASRLVNAALHRGNSDEARRAALSIVASTKGADPALQLLAWVYRTEHRENELLADLRTRIKAAAGDDAPSTLTMAATLDYVGRKEEAFATLEKYLATHPTDLTVLGRLLQRVDSPPTFARALDASARSLAAAPSANDDVMKLFLPTTELPSAGGYAEFIAPWAAQPRRDSFIHYLAGVTEQNQHAEPAVIRADFSRSLELKPDFLPAREAYVTWLLSQEKYADASAIIQEAIDKDQAGPKTWQLLVESEAAQQRLSHALQLAQEAVTKYPGDPEVRLQLATIYRLRGQNAEADTELNHLIDQSPKYEPAYKALIDGIARGLRDGSANNGLTTMISVLGRMNRELPESKFAQISSATIYARAGRLEESESMLRRLLAANPDDPDVLNPLAQVLQLLGHPDEAVTLLSDSLKQRPQLPVAEALISIYRVQSKPEAATALAAKLAHDNPTSEAFALLPSSIPLTDRNAALLDRDLARAERDAATAIPLMEAAAAHFPHSQEVIVALAHLQEAAGKPADAIKTLKSLIDAKGETPERMYMLSHFYSAADDDDAAVASLQRVLALMPDHTGANNDLGYFWVDEGIHLDEAERMIKKATDNEPNNSAFLDSLGWLLYKQGKFADAIPIFEKAVSQPEGMEPDVVQHLGDALYRAGRKPEAFERWTQALAMLNAESETLPIPKARVKLKAYLDHLKTAMRTGENPEVTPTASAPKPQSAGPTTTPATLPS